LEALWESFAPVKLFDVKKLKGLGETYRIRLGDWRVIYEFRRDDDLILVLDIAPRGRAY
jgi:mRNA interferase RelE/StbE